MPQPSDLPVRSLREPPEPTAERLSLAVGILAVALALLWILLD